jgi:hypothetical protein
MKLLGPVVEKRKQMIAKFGTDYPDKPVLYFSVRRTRMTLIDK